MESEIPSIPWQPAPLPENEFERLAELRNFKILDTEPEVVFDRLVYLVGRRFKMPAFIALIDEDRQWFKAHYGIDQDQEWFKAHYDMQAYEMPRELAISSYTILQDDVLVVHDAAADPRYARNPMVMGKPHTRFYAGAPLTTRSGYKLGAFCIIDRVPHPEFCDENKVEIAELASIVIDEMELRLSMRTATQDVDALKDTQRELEEARRKAEHNTLEKSQFVATISHELRTPMNGILGMVYLLNDTQLNTVQREYIETINHSAQNLLLLINDVLDLSKIEAGELIFEKKSFDIKTCFIQNVKLLKPLANKKNSILLYNVDYSVPDKVVGDQGRFAQIITNLVGNAVKFTEDGSVTASLRFDSKTNTIRCDIKDTGIGIPADKHEAVFEKFIQGDPSITQKYGGTGLGLSITKHLVLMLGGAIGFESKEKVGTHFWFTLPVTLVEERDPKKKLPNAALAIAGRVEVSEAYVLVAEDHPINQMFLIALLKKFGFGKVDVAENGVEVLETIRRNTYGYHGRPYDAIFMDCKMPELDGYDTTRMIRDQEMQFGKGFHIPIVAMTANALVGDREACFACGMDEYLSKPLQPERVIEVLAQWFVFSVDNAPARTTSGNAEELQPPLDFSRLQMVAETEKEKAALLEIFFTLTKESVSAMEDARRGEEFTRWKNAAHKLKGAAANMGMTALENICRECEKASNLTYSQRTALLRQMKNEIAHIKAYIAEKNPPLLNFGT